MADPKSGRNRALTAVLVIAALIAAPFVFIAFLATFDRSR